MIKIGNLFELAETVLQKEVKAKIIPFYTELDVIEYAVDIRKRLDNPVIMKRAHKAMLVTRKEWNAKYYQKRRVMK